jgi:hypothetical protein
MRRLPLRRLDDIAHGCSGSGEERLPAVGLQVLASFPIAMILVIAPNEIRNSRSR